MANFWWPARRSAKIAQSDCKVKREDRVKEEKEKKNPSAMKIVQIKQDDRRHKSDVTVALK